MIKETKNKGGRPAIVLTDEQISKVEELAGHLTCEQIADYLGISHITFQEIRARQEEVSFAYKKGKANKTLRYAQKLEAKAMGDDTTGDSACLIFYLKTQARWSTTEKKKPNLKIPNNKEPVKIIDAAIDGLNNGDLTLQEAQQLASLASTQANILANQKPGTEPFVLESKEDLWAKVHAIQKVIDYTNGKS